jgi:hypothetical protein
MLAEKESAIVAKKPGNISFEEAACMRPGGPEAKYYVGESGLRAGNRAPVIGADDMQSATKKGGIRSMAGDRKRISPTTITPRRCPSSTVRFVAVPLLSSRDALQKRLNFRLLASSTHPD